MQLFTACFKGTHADLIPKDHNLQSAQKNLCYLLFIFLQPWHILGSRALSTEGFMFTKSFAIFFSASSTQEKQIV